MVKVTIAHFARILTVTLLLIYEGILTPTQLEILREYLDRLEADRERERGQLESVIADLRQDRDHWRQQATALLTDQREKAPEKPVQGRFTRAWSILTGKG